MKTIEINGKLLPIIYKHIDYYPECQYHGTEIIIASYDGNIIKCSREFEVVDFDKECNPVYHTSDWGQEILCSITEL